MTSHKPIILLVHGLGRTKRSMKKLERHFSDNGYTTLNLGYPGLWGDFAQCLEILDKALSKKLSGENSPDRPIIAVGHSLGGLLLRALIARRPELNWRALIMLGTPNKGSQVARWLTRHWLWRWLTPTVAAEIVPESQLIQSLPPLPLPSLMIRGLQNWCWFIPVSWFYKSITENAAGDGVVTLDECLPPGAKADDRGSGLSIVDLMVHHSFMPANREVLALVAKFVAAHS